MQRNGLQHVGWKGSLITICSGVAGLNGCGLTGRYPGSQMDRCRPSDWFMDLARYCTLNYSVSLKENVR